MDILKHRVIYSFTILVLLLSQQLFADDDFNEFAKRIYEKDIKGIQELLASGVDVNIRNNSMGSTPLITACGFKGTEEIVELLISKGADVNIQTSNDGRTALMWASRRSEKNVELLLAEGADVNVKGKDGMTAFIQSIFGILSGSVTTKVCDLLIGKGADVNTQLADDDAAGWTALMFASTNGNLELVKYLLSKKADVNLRSEDGSTALNLAVKNKYDEIVKVLMANGAKE